MTRSVELDHISFERQHDMALKLFLAMALAPAFAFYACFDDGFTREAVIVYVVAVTIGTLATGLFIFMNRRVIDELTLEPSEKNVQIFHQLLTRRQSRKSNEGTDKN